MGHRRSLATGSTDRTGATRVCETRNETARAARTARPFLSGDAVLFVLNETLTRHRLRHLRGNLHRAGLVRRLHGETSSACAVPAAGSACGTVAIMNS